LTPAAWQGTCGQGAALLVGHPPRFYTDVCIRITVRGKRITVHLNDRQVIDYTEPDNVIRPRSRAGRRLGPHGGAIALQAHDPASVFYFKSIRIRELP